MIFPQFFEVIGVFVSVNTLSSRITWMGEQQIKIQKNIIIIIIIIYYYYYYYYNILLLVVSSSLLVA